MITVFAMILAGVVSSAKTINPIYQKVAGLEAEIQIMIDYEEKTEKRSAKLVSNAINVVPASYYYPTLDPTRNNAICYFGNLWDAIKLFGYMYEAMPNRNPDVRIEFKQFNKHNTVTKTNTLWFKIDLVDQNGTVYPWFDRFTACERAAFPQEIADTPRLVPYYQ